MTRFSIDCKRACVFIPNPTVPRMTRRNTETLPVILFILAIIINYLARDIPNLGKIWQSLPETRKFILMQGVILLLPLIPLPILTALEPGKVAYLPLYTGLLLVGLFLEAPVVAWSNPKLMRRFGTQPRTRSKFNWRIRSMLNKPTGASNRSLVKT